MNLKGFCYLLCILTLAACNSKETPINREALVTRNNPKVTSIDSLSSLSVGNGEFAVTVDFTGLQTFPEIYETGIPLGTQSQWGWHSFPNVNNYKHEETLIEYDFGRRRMEPYSVQIEKGTQRQKDAVHYFRANPHRLHLGIVGLELDKSIQPQDIKNINQELDMWNGVIRSYFSLDNKKYEINTTCHPDKDMISAHISSELNPAVKFHFAYPTGEFVDYGCDWTKNELHTTTIISQNEQSATLKRKIDETIYYVTIDWEGNATLTEKEKNYFVLSSTDNELSFSCSFNFEPITASQPTFIETLKTASSHWNSFWETGAAVDFSDCKDERAKELERRVVLSQYLLAIQCAGSTPPQETGLTYNSWFGKFHLEMIWWHQAQFALWGRPELLERTLSWYHKAYPVAKEIAERQGYDGIRWMKMTDPSGSESPSIIGSFLIWQQPHIIYLAELIYRTNLSQETIDKYYDLIQATADFMYSFAVYDETNDRYILKGIIPAQETLKPVETINPPFELSYWHYAMTLAQQWRERAGESRKPEWDALIEKLSPLAEKDGLYLAAESAPDTYQNILYHSDHMAMLGAYGILPNSKLFNEETMRNTLNWVWNNWNWDHTWGWDYPMTAMNAARLGEPEKAVNALLMDKRTNTYLPNGHNYQDERLRIYLPGNGGLLTAIAMMCAGWDGCKTPNPGFPKDGNWNVKWEGLSQMP
ncbi:MAG: hypothetical protein LBI82_13665 [Dysgonamonadaceae bacterium]|jgi:hypothetical protein|nr:hypothetical protein [Dysgonamonadaceae bacterium]